MAKVKIEFINTCAHCAETSRIIQKIAAGYGGDVELKEYVAGKDFDYLKKYGMISKGTMIINEKIRYDNLSKEIIEKAIKEAVQEDRNA